MDCIIREVRDSDGPEVMAIFNHYSMNTMAALWEGEQPPSFFGFLRESCSGYPFLVAECDGRVGGMALLRPIYKSPVFKRSAEVVYFLDENFTRLGLGSMLLSALEKRAKEMGGDKLVAHISLDNPASLAFHERKGFVEFGRLEKAGTKLGKDFSVVLMKKDISI